MHNKNEICWITGNGDGIPLSQMSTAHLLIAMDIMTKRKKKTVQDYDMERAIGQELRNREPEKRSKYGR